MQPYRRDASGGIAGRAPTALEYVPLANTDRTSLLGPFFTRVVFPAIAFLIGASVSGRGAALVALALALILPRLFRGAEATSGMLLEVKGDELRIYPRGKLTMAWRVPLEELEDVVLETKSIQRAVEGGIDPVGGLLGSARTNPTFAPPTDKNRIAFRARDGEVFPLTTEFLSHSDCLDWFGKIRVFLRKNGWVPDAEGDDKGLPESVEADETDEEPSEAERTR